LQHGLPKAKKEVPTFEEFAPRFIDGHARANRQKPSGIAATESILKWHLLPALGAKRLDAITNEQVQKLKLAMAQRAPKTVNNVLTVLSTTLKSRRMGRARQAAVHHQVVSQSQKDDGLSRLR
jgi:Phage integrase, N-terminal SAM-like domain